MSEGDSGDSERQGFIPYQLQIKPNPFPEPEKEKQSFNIFEPHYILGTTMLMKQPPQMYQRCLEIPQTVYSINDQLPSYMQEEEKESAFNTYHNTDQYRCIYSRYKDPLGNGAKLAFENELVLRDSPHRHYQMMRCLRPWHYNHNNHELVEDLVFDSKFQGGNLLSAFKSLKEKNTYVFFMQNDTNTYGYNQWFYYSIRNAKPNEIYTFRISNFKKKYSFFKNGMQPVLFSLEKARRSGNGWSRAGFNIRYYQSNFIETDSGPYYTLQFQISFEFQNDYVTLSPYPSYSYSRLMNLIKKCSLAARYHEIYFKLSSVLKSLGGNQIPYLIISGKGVYKANKPSIVILGRQHSGQIWSSYLIEQLLQEMIFERSEASQWLLRNYNFHIFPMINVDGVIYGNFRCDIAGYDLNRCWKNPSPTIHPQIYRMKEILQDLTTIEYCLDLHTHSKQFGVFAYCSSDDQVSRAFPYMLSKMTNIFRYRACTFGITKEKRQTARASIFQLAKSSNVITIQMSSFGVKNKNSMIGDVFQIKCMKTFASSLFQTLFFQLSGNQNKIDQLTSKNDLQSYEDEVPVEGSDSDPERDELEQVTKRNKILPKSSSKEFSSTLYQNKKKKVAKRLSIKKNTKMKSETDNVPSPDISMTKVKSRYNEPLIYTKKGIASKESSQNHFSNLKSRETPSQKFNKSVNLSRSSSNAGANKTVKSNFFQKRQAPVQKEQTPLNMFQFSLKKLPIFGGQYLPQNSHLLGQQNHSLMMTTMNLAKYKGYSQYGVERKPQKLNTISEQKTKTEQLKVNHGRKGDLKNVPFPYLCVMSESKKYEHITRIQQSPEKKLKLESQQQKNQAVFSKEAIKDGILTRLAKERTLNSEGIEKQFVDNYKKSQKKGTYKQ